MKRMIKIDLFELLELIQSLLLVDITKPATFEHRPTEFSIDGPLGNKTVRYEVVSE